MCSFHLDLYFDRELSSPLSYYYLLLNVNPNHFSYYVVTYTANIYNHFTVIGCVPRATVNHQWLLQVTTVHMTFNDTEEYSLRSIAILGWNICRQITVAHVTLPKAVLSTVKIFAVHVSTFPITFFSPLKYMSFWTFAIKSFLLWKLFYGSQFVLSQPN